MRHALIAGTACILALSGCLARYQGDENSPYYVAPLGSRVTLQQPLSIDADKLAVFIQDGRVQPFSQIRQYYPHCKFELYTMSHESRTVAPDEFTVIRVVQEEADSAQADDVLSARAGSSARALLDNDGGPSVRAYVTRLYLRSPKQPDVYRLNCAQWGYPLPLWFTHAVGSALGRLLYRIPNRRQRTARINLALCFPELAIGAREHLLRRHLIEVGKSVTESGALWTRDRTGIERLVRHAHGEHALRQALVRGRGVLLAVPHLGAWELIGLYCSMRYPLTALYRPPKNPAWASSCAAPANASARSYCRPTRAACARCTRHSNAASWSASCRIKCRRNARAACLRRSSAFPPPPWCCCRASRSRAAPR